MLYRIAFIFIYDFKLLIKRGWRILIAALLAFAVCMTAGRAGANLMYGKSIFSPFTVAIVDLDNSYETGVLFTNLNDIESLKGIVSFKRMSESDAKNALSEGSAEAYIILPAGFASGFENGANNPPVTVTRGGLKSELIKMFVNSAIGQLSASQAGVYVTLDNANTYGGQTLYDKAFQDINLTFISLFFSRESMLETSEVSAAGSVPPGVFFIINFFLFFCVLNTGFISDCFCGAGSVKRIRTAGVPGWSILVSHALFSLVINTVLAASIIIALFASGVFRNIKIYFSMGRGLELFVLMAALSALSVFWFALTDDRRIKGLTAFIFALLSLFFSGGLIPSSFLPSGLVTVKNLMFNDHAAAVLSMFFTKNASDSVPGLIAYISAAFIGGYILIGRKEAL